MAKWWRFAGKLLVIHAIHAYKQHKIWSQTNSIRTVCCMYKKLFASTVPTKNWRPTTQFDATSAIYEEFYDWDWCPSRCSVPRKIPIGRLRPLIVSRQDPHARTPRHHLASPEDPADRTNKPQYDYCTVDMYINHIYSLYVHCIFIVYHSLDVHMSCYHLYLYIDYQNFSVKHQSATVSGWNLSPGKISQQLSTVLSLFVVTSKAITSKASIAGCYWAARGTGELRFLIHVPTGFEVARCGVVAYRFISFES